MKRRRFIQFWGLTRNKYHNSKKKITPQHHFQNIQCHTQYSFHFPPTCTVFFTRELVLLKFNIY